jgi:hypothetical protein
LVDLICDGKSNVEIACTPRRGQGFLGNPDKLASIKTPAYETEEPSKSDNLPSTGNSSHFVRSRLPLAVVNCRRGCSSKRRFPLLRENIYGWLRHRRFRYGLSQDQEKWERHHSVRSNQICSITKLSHTRILGFSKGGKPASETKPPLEDQVSVVI